MLGCWVVGLWFFLSSPVSDGAEIHQFRDKDITVNDDSGNNDIALRRRASTGGFQPILRSPASAHPREPNTMLVLDEAKTCGEKPSSASSPETGLEQGYKQDGQHLFSG